MSAAHLVRAEEPQDFAAIREIHTAAFGGQTEANIVEALRVAGALELSFVAVVDDRVVGHVAFSTVTVADRNIGLGLAPVGVFPEHQRRGIGDALCRRGLLEASVRGVGAIVVLGHAAYYPRFGFLHAPTSFDLRWAGGHDESFFALELTDGALRGVQGLVHYRPELR